ncbi:MAG: arsenate reductase (glutaredoxin) [Cytophagales bacterium]|nr:arsenate reductase (glutaredoxin) [Cytophagales bacterium]
MIQIYHNPRCGKSRSALKILDEKELSFDTKLYLKAPPTFDELKDVLSKLSMKPEALLRKGEAIYKEQYKGKSLSDDEWINAMVENPILIERPIVISGDKAVVGRPPEKVLEII